MYQSKIMERKNYSQLIRVYSKIYYIVFNCVTNTDWATYNVIVQIHNHIFFCHLNSFNPNVVDRIR